MKALSTFVLFEGWFLLIGLGAAIGYQILTGRINCGGMLSNKVTGNISSGRVPLLLLTLMTAFYQLLQVLRNPTQFPKIPEEALLVLAGGHLAYLGGKYYSRSFRRERESDGQARK